MTTSGIVKEFMHMAIPTNHTGPYYFEVMADISAKRSTKRYLEIGVSTGLLLQHIHTELAVGVDPEFNLCENIMKHKKNLHLHKMTSDAFFADPDAYGSFEGPIDLAFLDGMHTFEFLLRDFYNTESFCGPDSLIALHDCLPLNAEMAHRNFGHSLEIGQGTQHPNFWTGDVWKIVPILKKHRPDLRVVCVMTPPTGIVFVTNLNPNSIHLRNNYLSIVDEFAALPNTLDEIENMYDSVTLVQANDLMRDFDHSLFFRS